MTPRQMLTALDVLAAHLHASIIKLDAQADEIAHQRMDLAMTQQHVDELRDQVKAFSLESERHIRTERRNMDTHGMLARVAGGARQKALEKVS